MNRALTVGVAAEGHYPKVLCVCGAGLLRAPTAAWVLSQLPFECNTRSAGLDEGFALVPVSKPLLQWADQIVVMSADQQRRIENLRADYMVDWPDVPVLNLDIPDEYDYRDPTLEQLVAANYREAIAREGAGRQSGAVSLQGTRPGRGRRDRGPGL